MSNKEKLLYIPIILVFLLGVTACGEHHDPEPVSEGSPTHPLGLVLSVPYPGQVGDWGTSYYAFTTGSSGVYTISLTDVESDLSWTLWSTPDFFTTKVLDCDDWIGFTENESCSINLDAGTTYYLQVDEWLHYPSYFTLTVF